MHIEYSEIECCENCKESASGYFFYNKNHEVIHVCKDCLRELLKKDEDN